MRLTRLAACAALVLAACYAEDTVGVLASGPRTTVEITDAPFPYDSVARVDLYIVSIAVRAEPDTSNTGTGWITVAEPARRFNLIALSGGVTDTLGGSIVPAGQYKAVRMVIDSDSSYVVAASGQRLAVDWQSSAGRSALYALVEDPLGVSDTGATVVVDFDVGRSFLCDAPCHAFSFSPVFRAVNRAATGAVSGTVTGDTLAQYAAPLGNVTITVFSGAAAAGQDAWWVRATGRTDATGHFRIAYLLPGTEVVNQGITLPRGTSSSVVVTPLPLYAYVGDSIELTATLVDSGGHTVPGASVTWSNLDTAVANLYVFLSYPDRALFRPKAAGTARILVTADGVGRTLTIPVLTSPPTGVSWVRLTPDSGTVAVGDSLAFTASARDSAGIAMPGQTYSWATSDSTVATVRRLAAGGATAEVRGLKAGTAVIRATSDGKTGSAAFRVQ